MEAVLKNMEVTVELVGVARHSSSVGLWDGPTLSRAFHWAQYCELVFHRFYNQCSIRRLMEQRLESTNSRLRATVPGYTCISFTDLSHLQNHLLLGLLSNPELPPSLITILCDSKRTKNLPNKHHEDFRGMCDILIRCKAACRLLRPLTDSWVGDAGTEVQAEMLMERLEDLLSHDSVAQGQHFCHVMAAALLTENQQHRAAQECVVQWLHSDQRVLLLMCSTMSAKLLSQLAKQHQTFKDMYLCTLHGWAAQMEYSTDEGAWIQTSTNPYALMFQELTQHFKELCEACSSLRENILEHIMSLKKSNGDYDVEGLSVWGDLWTALHK
uniref:FA complementation group F n=1 Tax=Gouania willdenowi TaxID=441366 RepID=A0A8C5GLX9_GOUWI